MPYYSVLASRRSTKQLPASLGRDEHNKQTGFKKHYHNRDYHQMTNNAVFPLDTKLGIPENTYDMDQ